MRRSIRLVLSAALLGASAQAWAQDHHGHEPPGMAQASPSASGDTAFAAGMAQAMSRMHAAMAAVPATGQPDRDFLAAMIPHHQGAIDMARAVLPATGDPRIRNLAQSIITEQRYEIELMRTLLADPVATHASTPEKHP